MNHDIDRTQVGFGDGSLPQSRGSVLNEDQNIHLASRLMDVNSEEELEYFLADTISDVANAAGKFISSPTGQALGSALKDVAKKVLPAALEAVGTRYGGAPGGVIAKAVGTAITDQFEVEPEEAEWEAANNFVKLATEAIKNAAEAPPGADPHAIAKRAIIEAAKIHAPGLVAPLTSASVGMDRPSYRHYGGAHHHHTGHWYRHGDRIILVGV